MRITFVLAHADLSGGVRIVADYAKRLAAKGHEIVVVSRPPRRASLGEKVRSALKRRPLPTACRTGPSHLDNSGIDHRIIDGHRAVTANDVPDADAVIATWWETAEWVFKYPRRKGAKIYFIQHYEAHEGLPADRVDATWRLPMHKIVIANWLAELSKDRFGDTAYSLVPDAVDMTRFFAPPRGKQAAPTIGMMYSHVPFKGCDISLKAFDLAAQKIRGLKLIAFGSRHPTRELPLPPGSEFIHQPPQDLIKDIYSRADAWLVASRSEGFGLPILEAMACRTPVIATPAGAAPELLASGGGLIVPHESPSAMAAAIEQICGLDDPDWRAMSEEAVATAASYNWERSTKLFEEALAEAIERQGAE
ncbi:MAG TPA: glycosyltransferase family 4 protein [Humisphaera sp.]|jgi:glycosyltransferase involved in cell wall biosynthesis|nr:glycosyltransferase family 4 protein [Humisphaera sp.]